MVNAVPARPYRILWANVYCMLDTSSGASMAIREMLRRLCLRGYEIAICGATVFDDPRGRRRIEKDWQVVDDRRGNIVSVKDDPLVHYLYVTASPQREAMTSAEENQWLLFYTATLDKLKPDLVFYYGGQALDMMVADEARTRGIPVAAYLANPNYQGKRWCRDVDLILTDSEATAQFYAQREHYSVVPVGTFIDPAPVVASAHSRERILFVNPSAEKGAAIVAQIALLMEKRRPGTVFEVVESRGSWPDIVRRVTAARGEPREALANVVLTKNNDDMRPVFGRARVILAPSLWWESAGRVLAEAMLNGIPAVVTDRGGLPEVIGDAGFRLTFPAECHTPPYLQLPTDEALEPVLELLVRMFEDAQFYEMYAQRALHIARQRHDVGVNTTRLELALEPLLLRGAARPDALATGPRPSPLASAPSAVPKVSVLMPVGEREEYLREAIDSILAQTLPDFELLLVADGVGPAVASILASYVDPRVRLIRLPVNVGISGARNAGLAAARAPYVALMDSDDVALPHRLEMLHAFLEANPDVTVCASNAIKMFPDGTRIPMRYPQTDGAIKARLLVVDSSILNPTAMYRMDFVRANRLRYDANFPPDDDHRFYVDMLRAGARFHALHEELLLYRRHAGNYTNDMRGVDAIKGRVRELLVPLFFPKLTGAEGAALVAALQVAFPAVPGQGAALAPAVHKRCLAALAKAAKEASSLFGEDRAVVAEILAAARTALEGAPAEAVA